MFLTEYQWTERKTTKICNLCSKCNVGCALFSAITDAFYP